MNIRKMLLAAGVAGLTATVVGSVQAQSNITVKGSDTMVILAQRWAEAFMQKNPGIRVQVTGGGSGTGAAALINGTCNIASMSRAMKEREKAQIKNRQNKTVTEIRVAKDGLAVYVHPDNPVKSLNFAQLKGIYTGRISNWKDVGGPDMPITRYSRENNSGTYVFFKEHVLGNADYHPSCQNMPGTASVVNAVARDKSGIGYGGLAYTKGVRDVPIAKAPGGKAVAPSPATVKDGSYPIWRYLYQYVIGSPSGNVKKLIDWELSPEGQDIVEKVGYIPVK